MNAARVYLTGRRLLSAVALVAGLVAAMSVLWPAGVVVPGTGAAGSRFVSLWEILMWLVAPAVVVLAAPRAQGWEVGGDAALRAWAAAHAVLILGLLWLAPPVARTLALHGLGRWPWRSVGAGLDARELLTSTSAHAAGLHALLAGAVALAGVALLGRLGGTWLAWAAGALVVALAGIPEPSQRVLPVWGEHTLGHAPAVALGVAVAGAAISVVRTTQPVLLGLEA